MKKTAEEILDDIPGMYVENGNNDIYIPINSANKAMHKFAKQQAIEFSEWRDGWIYNEKEKGWRYYQDLKKQFLKSTELYELFLKSKL